MIELEAFVGDVQSPPNNKITKQPQQVEQNQHFYAVGSPKGGVVLYVLIQLKYRRQEATVDHLES